jgi:hypothetical protein
VTHTKECSKSACQQTTAATKAPLAALLGLDIRGVCIHSVVHTVKLLNKPVINLVVQQIYGIRLACPDNGLNQLLAEVLVDQTRARQLDVVVLGEGLLEAPLMVVESELFGVIDATHINYDVHLCVCVCVCVCVCFVCSALDVPCKSPLAKERQKEGILFSGYYGTHFPWWHAGTIRSELQPQQSHTSTVRHATSSRNYRGKDGRVTCTCDRSSFELLRLLQQKACQRLVAVERTVVGSYALLHARINKAAADGGRI